MERSPVRATGVVLEVEGGPSKLVVKPMLGTCFAFRDPRYVLTAAHCVAGFDPENLVVALPTRFDRLRAPTEIIRHPEADVALMRLVELEEDAGAHAFRDAVENPRAEEFMAYGYPPMGMLGEGTLEPRLFRGALQRFMFPFKPEGAEYSYVAGEMSIPAPAGLSGGPLFRPQAPDMLIGMVTASLTTSVAAGVESFEEELTDGSIKRTIHRHVVSYGIALILDNIRHWLDEHAPPALPQ